MIPSKVGQQLEERFENLLKTQFRVRSDSGFAHLWGEKAVDVLFVRKDIMQGNRLCKPLGVGFCG